MTIVEKKESILIAAGLYGVIVEFLPLELSMLSTLFLFVFLGMTAMILLNRVPKIITAISVKTPILAIILNNLGVPACVNILFFLGFILLAQFYSFSDLEGYLALSDVAVYSTLVIALLHMIYDIRKHIKENTLN